MWTVDRGAGGSEGELGSGSGPSLWGDNFEKLKCMKNTSDAPALLAPVISLVFVCF